MTKTRLLAISLLPCVVAVAHAQQEVGRLSVVKEVKVTRTPVSEGRDYVYARDNQTVRNNYGLRTGRRSKATIHFFDKSSVSVNERTDLVISDSSSRRNIQLTSGAVEVKVAKGVNTTVQTPTATATARGTRFEVRANGEVLVYEGSVAVTAGGQTVIVQAGNKVSVGSGSQAGNTPMAVPLSPGEMPGIEGGNGTQWFETIEEDAGLTVGNGGVDFQDIRQSPVNETVPTAIQPTSTTVIIRGSRAPIPDSRREQGLIDNTETSYLIPAVALAGTLAVDANKLKDTQTPAFQGSAFAYVGDPAFLGIRGDLAGRLGDSTYAYEANVLMYLHDPETKPLGRFGSVLYLERRFNENLKIFAGRRKFYEGPVFSDAIDTQLIANRFSSVGARYDQKPFSAEVAYLYDANRYVSSAQSGALASVYVKLYGGLLGGHLLEADDVPGGGHGRTVSLSMPLIRGFLDGYGEFGTHVDGTTNETVGAYLPGFFQKTGIDVFFEYARKRDIAQAYSVTALYQIPSSNASLRGSLDWIDGDLRAGAGVSFKF